MQKPVVQKNLTTEKVVQKESVIPANPIYIEPLVPESRIKGAKSKPVSLSKAAPLEVKPTSSGYVVQQNGKTAGTIVKLPSGKHIVTAGTTIREAKTKAEAIQIIRENVDNKNIDYSGSGEIGVHSDSLDTNYPEPEILKDYFDFNNPLWKRDNPNGRGIYQPSGDKKEAYENAVIEKFLSSGYNVTDIPKSKNKGEKTADHVVKDFFLEVKELTVLNENRIISDIRDGIHQHAQIILIEALNIDISLEMINHAIIRFRGQRSPKKLPVEVWFWTKSGCIKYRKEV